MATGKKLTGINPLAYMGVEPTAPPQLVVQPFPPTPADVQNNNIGTLWIVTGSQVWMLVSLVGNIATWVQIYPSLGAAATFPTDAGIAVPVADVLNVLGGTNINTAGAGNTLTINLNDSIVVDDFEATGNAVIFSGLGASGVLQIDGGGNASASKGDDGEVLIGSTAGAPAWANITSIDTTVTITNGPNTIDLSAAGMAGIVTLDGDVGSATGATVTIAGGSNINTSAAAATVTVNLDDTVSISGSMTAGTGFSATTGDVDILAGSLTLPESNAALTEGLITLNGVLFLHSGNSTANANAFGGGSGDPSVIDPAATANTGFGSGAINSLTTGTSNIAIGANAIEDLTTGSQNVGIGVGSGAAGLDTGSNNTMIGYATGQSYAGAESNNILIGALVDGTLGESNATHIGREGVTTLCTIAGIFGVTIGGTGIPVNVDNTGQLGTVVSSRRFKDNIEDMGAISNVIHNLRPVTFTMKADKEKRRQMGLIAEEVEKVMPELVVHNEGQALTVRYDALPVLMLNELQMAFRVIDMHERTIFGLAEKVAELERKVGTLSKLAMCD